MNADLMKLMNCNLLSRGLEVVEVVPLVVSLLTLKASLVARLQILHKVIPRPLLLQILVTVARVPVIQNPQMLKLNHLMKSVPIVPRLDIRRKPVGLSILKKKNKNKKNINHTFCTNRVPHKDGVEFIMEGKLNKKHSSDILLDSGAGVSAINSKFCSEETKTGESMTVSSLKSEIAVGSYPVVQVPVETLTFKGLIEGVSVRDLKK